MNPAWSTVQKPMQYIHVASDMTPVWKSASQIPAFFHTIFEIRMRVSFAASREHGYSCGEIDDGSE